MNNLALATALATAPSSAFVELRERPRYWFPLLLVVLSTAAICYWYYSVVDIEWLKDLLYGNNPGLTDEQRSMAMSMTTRTTMMWASVIGTIIALPVLLVIEALLLLVAAKVTRVQIGFKHWFALTCWATLPALLSVVVAAIFLLLADSPQISPGTVSPLSVNELLVHRPFGSPGQGLLDSLNIPGFLGWALMIIGVHTWTRRSWLFSTLFVMLPTVVIYAVWGFFAFRQSP